MKIVYIVTRGDDIGGAQVHIRDLSLALLKAGHEVWVVTGKEGEFTRQLRLLKVPTLVVSALDRSVHPLKDIQALIGIWIALRRLSPDLVSTHSSKAGWLGRVAAWFSRTPVIFTAHGWAFSEGVPRPKQVLYAFLERLAAPFADKIITVSEYDRRLAIRRRIVPARKLVTVHNGVNELADAPDAAQPFPGVRLLMVARFSRQKNHHGLFQALARIQDEDWTLDLIGEGPLQEQTQALARDLGIADRVNFRGIRHDVQKIIANAHIYVLISNWEGFPRSILEAMRAALPVVASDVGGVREAVTDGETGYLVPAGDADLLTRRLKTLLHNHELRSRMGRSGRARFEREFEFHIMLNKTMDVYRELVPDA